MDQAVLNVVRGLKAPSTLVKYGIAKHGDTWSFPLCDDPVVVSMQALQAGLMAVKEHRELAREWASFLLAASNVISFEQIEDEPEGEQLIELLWRLCERD